MPRKLKVYQTSQGFYDLAVAAPTMTAALKAWGASASPELFRQGFAKESDDKDVIAAAMAQPGIVLRRPVGSNKAFREHAELPTAEELSKHLKQVDPPREKAPAPSAKKTREPAKRDTVEKAERKEAAQADEKAERKAAAAFEKEQRRRAKQRQKEEAAAARARARRNTAIDKAKSALERARREHDLRATAIEKDRAALESRAKAEEMRWKKLETRLEAALHKASR